ncbi:hypothetical protein SCLCIDRAFT_11643 [Scleroderma citrinum Foug A]|uniref:Uncharacterized protein n=1 Tax=Scleroderma citrinum Foug A TaxID=1036808 RepID=A0A0C3DA22_9AGAM|nr:hypothetical protein SCLCIDRAFT_11643 [Scleroderma citrinum Foug A]
METGWDGEDLSALMIPSGLPVSDIVFDDPTVIFTEELVDALNDDFTGFSWGPANIGLPITAFESNHSWPPPVAQPNYNIGNLVLNVDPVSIQAPAPFPQVALTPLHFCKPEMQAVLISQQMAKKAFAESVFEHVKRSANYAWLPEDVPWGDNKQHLWSKATYVIQNNNGLGGQPFNDSSLFNLGILINATVVEWWCTWNDSHGYGIFHSWKWEANQLVVDAPFNHAMFAKMFWVAAYGKDHPGWFALLEVNDVPLNTIISQQSLYKKAAICSWLITATVHFRSTMIASWCSAKMRRKVQNTIKNVLLFFLDILAGLRGRTKEQQGVWTAVVVAGGGSGGWGGRHDAAASVVILQAQAIGLICDLSSITILQKLSKSKLQLACKEAPTLTDHRQRHQCNDR